MISDVMFQDYVVSVIFCMKYFGMLSELFGIGV